MDEKKKSEVSILLEYVKVIVLTMIATFILLQFIQVSRVNGSSMENTYFQNNIVLIDKVFYKRQQPKRNDIIIVDYDDGLEDTLIIKRVIAVGGDHLDIVNNDGKKLKENYIKEKMDTEDLSIDIPKGKVFVMGDNRNHSLDSRKLGYFDFKDDVIGKVFFKIPF